MRDYLIFVDTETSGIPKNWKAPYSDDTQWPHVVQLAWVIYDQEGKLLKEENYYINDNDFKISKASQEVHGISQEYLLEHGHSRLGVMKHLQKDLEHFQPLLIAHYVKLDFHMLSAEFYRTQLENPLSALPAFCTMKATEDYIRYPNRKYLSLGELYKRLFQEPLPQPHNALTDAQATAACFFAMKDKGDINRQVIERQQKQHAEDHLEDSSKSKSYLYIILTLAVLFFLLLIFFGYE
ncbi:3'-5' exonuclease [Catalinimonas niigatensis]|uniref:3'-5' exonuclease n=1 Tax=Catalinimonas niigatensis TaxID=1397264 RepID=UPI0026655AC2|nr:3'-5' exonuclease [Catalinimonas niigatensis]WPP48308.1 3'-5' exonuclease [Catalinimonas niigatensis]